MLNIYHNFNLPLLLTIQNFGLVQHKQRADKKALLVKMAVLVPKIEVNRKLRLSIASIFKIDRFNF